MIKITIDENILKLTPRSKKTGKRLLWGWLSIQGFTILVVLGGISLFVWAGSRNFIAEKRESLSASFIQEDHHKTE